LSDPISVVAAVASTLAPLLGWPEYDVRRYTRLVYVDPDIRIMLETESTRIGKVVAEGVVDIMKRRMKRLRDRQRRASRLSQRTDMAALSPVDRRFVDQVEAEIERREREFRRLTGGA